MAQLLYLSKRERPDIQIEVSFLCTIVIGPDADGYQNLSRVMKYIQGTIVLPMILSIDNSGNITWYVDASFAVHKDTRSHTGGFMTMGKGGAYLQSSNMKLKIKSSTEADLFRVDDLLSKLIWIQLFLK